MSDKYIEKTFLYLLACSVVLHAAIFTLLMIMPQEHKPVPPEPYMVELRDLPEPPPASPGRPEKEVRRLDEKKRRVEKETAPKGEMERDSIASFPRPAPRRQPVQPQARPAPPQLQQRPVPGGGGREMPRPADRGDYRMKPDTSQKDVPVGRDSSRARRERVPDLAKLLPSAEKMATLEENYRKKYGPEVEEGETKFLSTDDIMFGSFLRRFETAVYGVWKYPSEAVHMGIEGMTPARITFNRAGEVVNVQVLESSGSRILDEEVLRTLRHIGPVGGFPKGYQKDTFNLIAFFQYGLVGGSRRLR